MKLTGGWVADKVSGGLTEKAITAAGAALLSRTTPPQTLLMTPAPAILKIGVSDPVAVAVGSITEVAAS